MTTNQIDPEDIELKATAVGCDLLLLISGGVRHIGATSTAYLEGSRLKY